MSNLGTTFCRIVKVEKETSMTGDERGAALSLFAEYVQQRDGRRAGRTQRIKMKTATKPKGEPQTDPAALAYWWMETYRPEGSRVSHAKHCEMHGACYQLFTYVSRAAGYDRRSNQWWARVALPRGADIDAALAELALFLPYIRPTDGYKHLGVLEHTLSADGMYELREYSAADIQLIITTYGRERVVERFESWSVALVYVRSNHWYAEHEGGEDAASI